MKSGNSMSLKHFQRIFSLALLTVAGLGGAVSGLMAAEEITAPASVELGEPKVEELLPLVRSHLDRNALPLLEQSILDAVFQGSGGRVRLANPLVKPGPGSAVTNLFEPTTAYFRIEQLGSGLAAELKKLCEAGGSGRKLNGLVLDLRFAFAGTYSDAAAVLGLFVGGGKEVFQTQEPIVTPGEGAPIIKVPTVVLINGRTSGPSEALAHALRRQRLALLIGSSSAGEAFVFKSYELKTGGRVEIAESHLKVGEEDLTQGVVPDVSVPISLEKEAEFLSNPYQMAAAETAEEDLVNEAELVRRHNVEMGLADPNEEVGDVRSSGKRDYVNDPVLGRALDLIKGLIITRPR